MENHTQDDKIILDNLQLKIGDTIFNVVEANINQEETSLAKVAIKEAQDKLTERSEALRYSTDQELKSKEEKIAALEQRYANVIPILSLSDAIRLKEHDIYAAARENRLVLFQPYTYYPLYITNGDTDDPLTYKLPAEVRKIWRRKVYLAVFLAQNYSSYIHMLSMDTLEYFTHAHSLPGGDCTGEYIIPLYKDLFTENNRIADINKIVTMFNSLGALWQTINVSSLAEHYVENVNIDDLWHNLMRSDTEPVQTSWTT